jgi:hypothetical protein
MHVDAAVIRARNVATVEALYESERARDLSAWVPLWHPAGRQTFPFAPGWTVTGIERLAEVTRRKFDIRPSYEIHVHTEPFDDPGRVLARVHLVCPGYEPPTADLWCIFHFDSDGLIVEVEEMLDTASGPEFPQ